MKKLCLALFALAVFSTAAAAQSGKPDIRLNLNSKDPITHAPVKFKCMDGYAAIGLTQFVMADFVRGGGVDLLTIQISGTQRVFAGVIADGFFKYAWGPYTLTGRQNYLTLTKVDATGKTLQEVNCMSGNAAQ